MTATSGVVIFSLSLLVTLAALGLAPASSGESGNKLFRGLLVALALAVGWAVYGQILLKMVATPTGYIRTWNVFHYYLGAKYFDELGYFDLYHCTLAADSEMFKIWGDKARIRDLRSYQIRSRPATDACPKARFSPKRWRDFKSDLLFIQGTTTLKPDQSRLGDMPAERVWPFILTDKGFNPSPVWTVTARWLTNHISPDWTWGFKLLLSLDFLLLVVAFYVVGRAFGLETALLVFIFAATFWGPYRRLVGNILQYAWLFALLMAASFWKLKRLKISAFFLAYALMTMGFPALLVSGLFMQWMWGDGIKSDGIKSDGVKNDGIKNFVVMSNSGLIGKAQSLISFLRPNNIRTPAQNQLQVTSIQSLRMFFIWLALFCAIFFAYSLLLPHPFRVWHDFFEKMRLHGTHLSGELFNVGLKNLLSTCCTATYQQEFVYVDRLAGRLWLYYPLAVILVGLFVISSLRWRDSGIGLLALGFGPVFALLTLSRYYYVGMVILLLAEKQRRGALIGLLGSNLCFFLAHLYFNDAKTVAYSYWGAQVFLLFFFMGLLIPWSVVKTFITGLRG